VLLRLQEVALKLRLDPLKPLLGSIASDGGESSSRGGYLCALGFRACGIKFDEHVQLYTGLFRSNHRQQRSSQLPSSNPTLSREDLKENQKGAKLVSYLVLKSVSD
jgi:hypothetical protein